MLSSIPHQKFCFYHLPTPGQAGIKLGDAWYVSNVSIIFDCSMLLYYLFWMFNGLYYTLLYYFWDYPINRRLSPNCCFFAYFSVSKERNIKRSPNGMEPSGMWFSEQTWSRGLGVDVKKSMRRPRGREARLPPGRAPPSWAPRSSTDLLLPPIYIHIPPKHPGAPRNPISTTAAFCSREIPSWGLFRRSARGGIDHGGLLHQHHSLSDDVWVAYHRPSGP